METLAHFYHWSPAPVKPLIAVAIGLILVGSWVVALWLVLIGLLCIIFWIPEAWNWFFAEWRSAMFCLGIIFTIVVLFLFQQRDNDNPPMF